jgi:hypothetical protein
VETNGIDRYLKKHSGGVHMTHSKTLDENDDIIREANKAELEEGAAEANKKAAWEAKLKKQNKFDGLVHNDDGTRQFTDSREIVGGVNNYIKKHLSKTKSHKKHHMS